MLILGTAQFGSNYGIKQDGQPSPPEIDRILKTARRAGITKVDTAPAYGNMVDFDQFKVITKTPYAGLNDYYALLHHNPYGRIEDIIFAKKLGFVERIGISVYTPEQLERVIDEIDIVQIPLNLADNRFIPYLPELRKRGIEIHARSAFLQGALLIGAYGLPQCTVADCLGFVLSQDVDGVVVGVNTAEQLQELVKVKPNNLEGFGITDDRIRPDKWGDMECVSLNSGHGVEME